MNEKSLWGIFGGKKSKPMTTVESRCPVCHNARDPRWSGCPYCDAKAKANQPTGMAADVPQGGGGAGGGDGGRRRTQVDDAGATGLGAAAGGGGGNRKSTMVDSSPGTPPGVGRHVGGGRRLTGIVHTFTWSGLGQLFEVHDGRNYAGSGVVSANNDAECDILLREDPVMSSSHFMILCQNGKYIISDLFSTNGTFVNGVQIDTRGEELVDHAVIKAGNTVFTFQKIHPVAGATTASTGGAQSFNEPPVSGRRPTDVA